MNRVFDASALLNVIRLLGTESYQYLKGSYILTLTLYEVGNALWKETTLMNKLSISEAQSLMNSMERVFRILNIAYPRNVALTLKLAHELRLTFYDASYITVSHELDAELVTDDMKLRKRVAEKKDILLKILGGEVTIYSTRELIEEKRDLKS